MEKDAVRVDARYGEVAPKARSERRGVDAA